MEYINGRYCRSYTHHRSFAGLSCFQFQRADSLAALHSGGRESEAEAAAGALAGLSSFLDLLSLRNVHLETMRWKIPFLITNLENYPHRNGISLMYYPREGKMRKRDSPKKG